MIEWAINLLVGCFVLLFKYVVFPILALTIFIVGLSILWIIIDSIWLQKESSNDKPFSPPLPSRFFGLGD